MPTPAALPTWMRLVDSAFSTIQDSPAGLWLQPVQAPQKQKWPPGRPEGHSRHRASAPHAFCCCRISSELLCVVSRRVAKQNVSRNTCTIYVEDTQSPQYLSIFYL